MSPGPESARSGSSSRSARTARAGCLAYLFGWFAIVWAPELLQRVLGWPYAAAASCAALVVMALTRIRQIRRRGQTIREALAQQRAERDGQRAERRHRAELRGRVRRDAAMLPWLSDKRLSPADVAGVLITPAPEAPAYYVHGHDVLLDSAGDRPVQVIRQVRKLTRLSLKDANDLVDSAPVPVLRLPEVTMALAAKNLLESAGATVSIAQPGSLAIPAPPPISLGTPSGHCQRARAWPAERGRTVPAGPGPPRSGCALWAAARACDVPRSG
jgi:ribosomal protein L7/L12